MTKAELEAKQGRMTKEAGEEIAGLNARIQARTQELQRADPVIQGLIGRREAYAEFLAALKAKKPPADPPADQK